MPATQENRQISVTSPLGQNVLLFRQMQGRDQLSCLSEYHIEMLSTQKSIPFGKVLGKPMSVKLTYQKGGEREFNGIVTSFSCSGGFAHYTQYRAVVQPWLWLLTKNSDCRIFQDDSVLDIMKKICEKDVYGGMANVDISRLQRSYPKLPYCVQYRETDYNFICRLFEHAGIYFYFKHSAGKAVLVLADSYLAHSTVPNFATIPFASDDHRDRYGDERISKWITTGEIQASGFELNDFDFEQVARGAYGLLKVKESIPAPFEQPSYQLYDFPGGFNSNPHGQTIATARMEACHGQAENINAVSNARGLVVGALFGLKEHPDATLNRDYLITQAVYQLAQDDYGTGGTAYEKLFSCQFNALGKKFPFRPLPQHAKPHIHGPQTALVVGKAGEEIWTDKYGRVKVQFHWDRLGNRDEKSSCWVRVSQNWAGKRWGAMFIPRIGMEVIVEFIDGDPDRPLITGCVYNSDTMPPYDLPAHQTRSTLMSHSTKGGGGFNELRFEDKKGAEEIFIQAQKDAKRVVKHNDSLRVGFLHNEPGSQHIAIKHDQTLEIGNDQHSKIDGQQEVQIGKTLLIEAGTSIELKVGASSLLIEPGKISLKAPEIDVCAAALAKITGALVKIN